eukprot:snap_masked-scaffold_16-processed-gene-6.88-mRNA-1 protein AED:1.00 eAED:1.00 QI:0/0/0/0/1/1/2/0/69
MYPTEGTSIKFRLESASKTPKSNLGDICNSFLVAKFNLNESEYMLKNLLNLTRSLPIYNSYIYQFVNKI